jgi:hypothetical protein
LRPTNPIAHPVTFSTLKINVIGTRRCWLTDRRQEAGAGAVGRRH